MVLQSFGEAQALRGEREETAHLGWRQFGLLLQQGDQSVAQDLEVAEGLLNQARVDQAEAVDELEGLKGEQG